MSGQTIFDIALLVVVLINAVIATSNVVTMHRWQQEQRRYWREKREGKQS